jgi:hypothetical protein
MSKKVTIQILVQFNMMINYFQYLLQKNGQKEKLRLKNINYFLVFIK